MKTTLVLCVLALAIAVVFGSGGHGHEDMIAGVTEMTAGVTVGVMMTVTVEVTRMGVMATDMELHPLYTCAPPSSQSASLLPSAIFGNFRPSSLVPDICFR
ncbi:hypothetical protein ACOMHN_019752 [Nucella lapillus]